MELKRKKKKKKIKRLKVKRITKPVSPYHIFVRDWGYEAVEHKQIELNEDSSLEIHIHGKIYRVKINKKNRCLEFDTLEESIYLQPISTKQFLVRGHTKEKQNG